MSAELAARAEQIENLLPEMMRLAQSSGLAAIVLPFGSFCDQQNASLVDKVEEGAKRIGLTTRRFQHQAMLYLELKP